MRKALGLLLFCMATIACKAQKPTYKETVIKYYNARDTGNYNRIKNVITDSITIIAGDYVMPYDKASFHEQFKWDSIFKPSYKIVKLVENDSSIIATVTQECIRNAFLKNNPLKCSYKISFESGKISKIEDANCINVDWGIWTKQRDDLINWIKKHHPELDGCVYDMTMKGSLNYVKAIELFETNK